MFSCITNYFTYYYNFYFNKPIENTTIPKNKTTSTLEINDLYELIFSTTNDSPQNIELVFYKMYSNEIEQFYPDSKTSSIFKYNNKIFKIGYKKNYNNYISVINTILNYKLKNIVIPEQIYYNKFKKNEYIEIFPYYPDGDLFNYVDNNTFTIDVKINIFKQIVNIISTFHNKGLAHRDIKLENFLIQKQHNNINIKITDLDFSSIATKDLEFLGGTLHYASYELINHKKITSWYSSDIWSLTVILYILLFNTFPWSNSITYNTYNKCINKIDEPCKIFNNYIIDNPITYWNKHLSTLFKKDDIYFTIFSHLLTYGFNKNWNARTDINYIQNLLSHI
jgi:serine/threonine protein kinase